jgi:hypothetical protein
MILGSIQPVTEMSTRNLPGSKGRSAHKADNLTAICKLTVWKMWNPQISQPCGPSWPVTGIALPFKPPQSASALTRISGTPQHSQRSTVK